MELREIEKLIKSYINQSLEGHSTENSKFDFKRQWYNLNDLGGINEFLKDTTAIANTFGPDGFIVIGFDEKDRSFSNSQFKDCGLRDQADIINLINKKIDRLFDINIYTLKLENHNLSVINIPPSIDKPHVIRNYITINNKGEQKTEVNKVFVKKGTTTQTAGKNDYELMFGNIYHDPLQILLQNGKVLTCEIFMNKI